MSERLAELSLNLSACTHIGVLQSYPIGDGNNVINSSRVTIVSSIWSQVLTYQCKLTSPACHLRVAVGFLE
eukprot:scaffold98033_cov23-Cyclotella_meneghiniana.AAC.2